MGKPRIGHWGLVLTQDQILCVVLIQDQTLGADIDQDGLLWLLNGKESICNAGASGDVDSIPGSGRSPGGGKGNPLQYCCLGNPIDRVAWWATVHGVAKSRTHGVAKSRTQQK